eukprot:scaffold6468_cov71-Phaeocystis_antarctica.AAC.3
MAAEISGVMPSSAALPVSPLRTWSGVTLTQAPKHLTLAHHPTRQHERERHQGGNLELLLVFLHPCERSVLEDLRPLLRGRLVAEVSRDLAHATLVVRLVRARVNSGEGQG